MLCLETIWFFVVENRSYSILGAVFSVLQPTLRSPGSGYILAAINLGFVMLNSF